MDQELWHRLKGIVDEALEREGADRQAFIDRACAQAPGISQELRSLARVAGKLEENADDATVSGVFNVAPPVAGGPSDLPSQIGPYRVLSKLGEGGMGVVYEAEQANPRRRVAVKIVRGGHFVDDQRIRLFQREADALARLKHPGIGAIYESGRTEDGQHFFAMELVHGDTLDVFTRKRPEIVSETEVRFRLSLFQKIVDAVHYAHQRGVIHRDLKPSNIIIIEEPVPEERMISADRSSSSRLPEVKILDFGLARITEGDLAAATMMTEIGVIKGTLPYMSPEQARGNPEEIDLRSDVYALGVILYELLSGRRPYDMANKSLVESLRVICEQTPHPIRSASSSLKRLDPDVETIVGRALEKDAAQRYASAAALSEDIGRYLTAQPILARPPSTIYQLRKFAKRNKALVGGVLATFVVLVAGIFVSTTLGVREARQRREAVMARNELQTVVDFQSGMLRSVDPREMGLELLKDIRQRVAVGAREEGLTEAEVEVELASLDRALGRINSTDAALRVIDQDVLDRAARSIEERFTDQPLVEARLRASLGRTYFDLGLLEKGEANTLQALEIQRRELGSEHLATLGSKAFLSVIYERQGRLGEAEQLAREAYEASRRVLGEEHESTLSMLNRLGVTYDVQERFEEAMQAYQSAYERMRKKLGDDHPETIWLLHNIGSLHRRRGRLKEAEAPLEEAFERFRRTLGDEDRGTLWAMESLGFLYHEQGRLDEAERINLEALDRRRRLLGDDHNKTLVSADSLAGVYRDQGRLDEAQALYRDTLEKRRHTIGSEHWLTLWTLQGLAETLTKQRRFEEAATLYEEILASRRKSSGESNRWTLDAKLWVATTYRQVDRYDEAAALLEDVLEARIEAKDSPRPDIGRVHGELAIVEAARGDGDAAGEHLRQAIDAVDETTLAELRQDPEFEALFSRHTKR